MHMRLNHQNIIVGVTGSIAAYKSAELTRRLKEEGAAVRVVMTDNAKKFITPLTMQAVSGHPVHDELFDLQAEAAMGHIELARFADLILIAPASASLMARLAHGDASDLLTTLCLASAAKIAIAPAMNQAMWHHAATQANVSVLKSRGVLVLGPDQGSQACGDLGFGRMREPDLLVSEVISILSNEESLAGVRILMTAGPTQEALDPVRYLSNGSSGKMGYALAESAKKIGAQVTLITGPVALKPPVVDQCIAVRTADEMHHAVMEHVKEADIFIGVAAVSDYRAANPVKQKIAKTNEKLMIELVRNEDIIASVGALTHKPFIVGFAAETHNVLLHADAKRLRKGIDLMIANVASEAMGSDTNSVTVLSEAEPIIFGTMSKAALANELIQLIGKIYRERQSNA